MSSKTDSVINRAKRFVNEGQPYTYGGKNQPMNRSNKSRVESFAKDYKGKSNFNHILGNDKTNNGMNYKKYINAESSNFVLIDCSGLTNVAFKAGGIDISHGSSNQNDTAKKKATRINPEKNSAAIKPGALLHRSGHVAVMGYNNKVIEAKGWRYGCVEGQSKASDYTSAYNLTGDTGSGSTEQVQKPSGPVIGKATVVNISSYLNVRPAPNTSNTPFGKLYSGNQVDVTGDHGDWYEINYNGRVGYISKQYAKFTATEKKPDPKPETSTDNTTNAPTASTGKVKITASALNVRTTSNTTGKILGTLSKNTVVEFTGIQNGWYQISFKGKVGYISGKYATVVSTGETAKPATTPETTSEPKTEDVKTSAGQVKITASALNVRTTSNTTGKILGTLSKNTVVDYAGMKDGWYQINYQGKTAYISGKYAEPITTAAPAKPETKPETTEPPKPTTQTVYVTASSLNVRAESNANSQKLGSLANGTAVGVLETKNGWHKISYKQQTGWICADYTSPNKPKASGNIGKSYDDYSNYLSGGLDSVKKDNSKQSYSNEEKYALDKISAKLSMIDKISSLANLPRELVAGIWYREMSFKDGCYLHNGDPLGTPTTHVPAGIYFGKDQFVEAAVHALGMKQSYANQLGLSTSSKDYAAMCAYCEAYNGFGYRNKGCASAYVASGTDKYTGGMYVADGKFDANVKDGRVGVLRIFMLMAENFPR